MMIVEIVVRKSGQVLEVRQLCGNTIYGSTSVLCTYDIRKPEYRLSTESHGKIIYISLWKCKVSTRVME